MGVVQPGGVSVSLNAVDNTQRGIDSAKQRLQDLTAAANSTTDKLQPLKEILSGGISAGAGVGGMAAISGGLTSLFDSTGKAASALKRTEEAIGSASSSASNGAAGLLRFGAGFASLSAIAKGSLQAFSGLGAIQSSVGGFFQSIKDGYTESVSAFAKQAQAAKEHSAEVLKNKDRLIELVKTRQKSAEQVAESVRLVNQMNATYKGLGLTVDQTTGKIGNVKNLKNRIDAAHALNLAEAEAAVQLHKTNQLNQIAARFGVVNATAKDRQAAATLLLSNAEAGAALKKKILSAETYKNIAANIQSVFWKKSATTATHGQSFANAVCSASNVLLGVTAKGASAAFLALKASMATNPLGWILLAVEGVALLATGIYNLVKKLWDVPSAAAKAAEEMEKLNKSNAQENSAQQRMLERLAQLNRNGGAKTAAEKKEAQDIVNTLNAYHGLGLEFDSLTGKVNMNSKALERNRNALLNDRKFRISSTIEANERLLEEQYQALAKEQGREEEYKNATGEAKIRIRMQLDLAPGKKAEDIAALKNHIEELYQERQRIIDEQEKKARAQLDRLNQQRDRLTANYNDFVYSEKRDMKRSELTDEEREIEAVKEQYRKLREPIQAIVREKKRLGADRDQELTQLVELDRLEKQRLEALRQQQAEKAKQREEEAAAKEAETDRALVEKLTEDRNRQNRTALQNEIHELQKSIAARKERLQKLVDEGKATDEQKRTLEEIIQLEKQRIEQLKQQNAERLKAQIQQFDDNQANRARRLQEAAEDKRTREDIRTNPFKAGQAVKDKKAEIDAKVEEAKRKVEEAHAFARQNGDLNERQKKVMEERERNLLDLQQQQERMQGLLDEAENEARSRVVSLLSSYAQEKTPSVLDSKFHGTAEAFRAEIENQQRGQMDGKDVKLDNIQKILERDEQRKQQSERQIIEIGRQIMANLQGV